VKHRTLVVIIILSLLCLLESSNALAQKLIITLKLDPAQIGLVKTAQGLTTRLAFAEPVKEVICGDLYDPASGKGTFVVQRSDNDVFIKPITTRGASNLFVRTGDKIRRVYNFDLSIVTFDMAYRVVNVENEETASQQAPSGAGYDPGISARDKDDSLKDAQTQAAEILRSARQQASNIIAEAQQSADEMQRQATAGAPQQVQHRFVTALLGGLTTTRITNPHVVTQQKVTLRLDREMYTFEGRTYMRYTIQNSGTENFVYTALRLQAVDSQKLIPTEVVQSKPENRVVPGETLAGILVFDQKLANSKDKLVLSVQGKDDNTLAHIVVQ